MRPRSLTSEVQVLFSTHLTEFFFLSFATGFRIPRWPEITLSSVLPLPSSETLNVYFKVTEFSSIDGIITGVEGLERDS